ncbi:Trithorax group protein osa [Caenorhabditis elegans]|uniref:Trithorax group protein osa n=1 Tax=Caenorhabditis elegans TaxID=6239 RepID=Q9N4J9_CAEEL|nr:Trithorax group protein osa [Caenorhabditis elegans]CCD71744.1 Trithorax group protein osa [Caenorhabditis elegans]|eukprot:NP_494217.1 Uncharacterized protein CELE_F54A3.6 [Caenorhabditis elegans]
MQNHGGNGYNGYPPPERRFYDTEKRDERWREERRSESWRENPQFPRREEAWRPIPPQFQLGRDRAPMPVDDAFLVRYGAKRLNNGNLVDRDGYTLKIRDPDCRAPSPPKYNPGRELRRYPDALVRRSRSPPRYHSGPREDRFSDRNPPREHSPPPPQRFPARERSPAYIPGRSIQSAEKPGNWSKLKKNDLEEKARKHMEMMKELEQKEHEIKEKRPKIDVKPEEIEGEDEYEDVEEPIPPPNTRKTLLGEPPAGAASSSSPSAQSSTGSSTGTSSYQNNIKKALIPGKPPGQPIIRRKPASWYEMYKKQVDSLKEQVYGKPNPPPPSAGYFFQAPPPAPASSSSTVPPAVSPFGVPLGAQPSTTSSTTYSSNYSNPSYPPPPKVDLPPPGIVQLDRVVYPPVSPPSPPLAAAAPRASEHFVRNGPVLGRMGQTAAPPPPPPPPEDDSDSEEDEAIVKLREIIRNYGTRT